MFDVSSSTRSGAFAAAAAAAAVVRRLPPFQPSWRCLERHHKPPNCYYYLLVHWALSSSVVLRAELCARRTQNNHAPHQGIMAAATPCARARVAIGLRARSKA
jgi:hypothetical protein